MIENWDLDEKAKDSKTYANREDGLDALNYMVKKYLLLKNRKIDPRKPLDYPLDLIEDTLLYDKEFHKFALDNYSIFLSYDEKNDLFYIGK
jgi:hypothetical protein